MAKSETIPHEFGLEGSLIRQEAFVSLSNTGRLPHFGVFLPRFNAETTHFTLRTLVNVLYIKILDELFKTISNLIGQQLS